MCGSVALRHIFLKGNNDEIHLEGTGWDALIINVVCESTWSVAIRLKDTPPHLMDRIGEFMMCFSTSFLVGYFQCCGLFTCTPIPFWIQSRKILALLWAFHKLGTLNLCHVHEVWRFQSVLVDICGLRLRLRSAFRAIHSVKLLATASRWRWKG